MRLYERKDDKVQTYSHGMKRRLGLAEVLIKEPEIAILDEPTQGLDPESAAEFLELIRQLKQKEHITILLSSHLLNQVQSVCDRVGLFSRGSMLISGTVDELADRVFGGRITTHLYAKPGTAADLTAVLQGIKGVGLVESSDDGSYRIESDQDVRPQLARAVVDAGGEVYEISSSRHDLDSIYRAYYKEVAHAA